MDPNYYEEIEKKRKEALTNWDALTYYECCNELGDNIPEEPNLYEQGAVDNILNDLNKKNLETITSNKNYSFFIKEAEKEGINYGEFSKDTGKKTNLLIKYFEKFREGGSQDLEERNYSSFEIGKIYNGIRNKAKKAEALVKATEYPVSIFDEVAKERFREFRS
jgi:hypothetical protein